MCELVHLGTNKTVLEKEGRRIYIELTMSTLQTGGEDPLGSQLNPSEESGASFMGSGTRLRCAADSHADTCSF